MTVQELLNRLRALGVTPPDPLRACLYLQELETTTTFLTTTLATPAPAGLGANYALVRTALQDPKLLSILSEALDPFVVEAVNADLTARANGQPIPPANFQQYYLDTILTNYPADRIAFYVLYPVTGALVQAIGNNFRNNIREACQRIIQDWNIIQAMFLGQNRTLERLTQIKSSGSDFHKGGKQVLLLTFDAQGVAVTDGDIQYVDSTLKLVYKPADLEADCLLIGKSAAVNAVRPGFLQESLFELLNRRVAQAKAQNPNLNLEALPTYKILPFNYGSSLPAGGGGNVNIRSSYGYIEFLYHSDYEPYAFLRRFPTLFSYYPFGSSDFKIFPRQNAVQISQKFYRIIGQITAIASTFSLIDLHVENIIVKDYLPFPIDMEICLSTLVQSVTDTSLYGVLAGVTGTTGPDNPTFYDAGAAGNLSINMQPNPENQQNRLWTITPLAMVDPAQYAPQICKGFRDMINVLQVARNQNVFNPWLARLTQNNGVVVRYLPLATGEFRSILSSASNEINCHDPNRLSIFVSNKMGTMYQTWFANPQANVLDPKFLALQNAYVLQDYQNADIPIFYHRIGTRNIMDSRGIPVIVPAQITYIPDVNNPLHTVQVNINLGVARGNNYFAQPPLQMRIVNRQLQEISADPQKTTRVRTLVRQVLNDLHLASTPANITTILQ